MEVKLDHVIKRMIIYVIIKRLTDGFERRKVFFGLHRINLHQNIDLIIHEQSIGLFINTCLFYKYNEINLSGNSALFRRHIRLISRQNHNNLRICLLLQFLYPAHCFLVSFLQKMYIS